jgi:hypothetical protein
VLVVTSIARQRLLGVVLAAGFSALALPASAVATQLVITSPQSGSATNNTSPTIAGETTPLSGEPVNYCVVKVKLYEGEGTAGRLVEEVEPSSPLACSWVAFPGKALAPGTYTLAATNTRHWYEEGWLEETESSQPVTFTVDTTAPAPSIASPSPGTTITGSSLAVSGSAGTATGDLATVTVELFAGSEAAGAPVEAIEAPVQAGSWSGALGGIAPGTYTLLAQQGDWAGNVGTSAPVPITVLAAPPPPPPAASFTWFPEIPRVGETVTLVSSSTDPSSPITTFAWGLSPTAPFSTGRPTTTTTFSTPGAHVVRLEVTDAAGRNATASKTILVRHQAITLMQPFPIVRIAGRETRSGVRLTLLTVAAPVSARITVRVQGKHVHTTSQSRVATVGKNGGSGGTSLISFPRFARSLSAGTVLEIRVTKPGEIGKLTRFIPRRGKLPIRVDHCLSAGEQPIPCPSS